MTKKTRTRTRSQAEYDYVVERLKEIFGMSPAGRYGYFNRYKDRILAKETFREVGDQNDTPMTASMVYSIRRSLGLVNPHEKDPDETPSPIPPPPPDPADVELDAKIAKILGPANIPVPDAVVEMVSAAPPPKPARPSWSPLEDQCLSIRWLDYHFPGWRTDAGP